MRGTAGEFVLQLLVLFFLLSQQLQGLVEAGLELLIGQLQVLDLEQETK